MLTYGVRSTTCSNNPGAKSTSQSAALFMATICCSTTACLLWRGSTGSIIFLLSSDQDSWDTP